MQIRELPLEDKSLHQMWVEGRDRLCAKDREHPAARFYIRHEIKQQLIYEAQKEEQASRERELGNLALQPTLDFSSEAA